MKFRACVLSVALLLPACTALPSADSPESELGLLLITSATAQYAYDYPDRIERVKAIADWLEPQEPASSAALGSALLEALGGPSLEPRERLLAADLARAVRIYAEARVEAPETTVPAPVVAAIADALRRGAERAEATP